MNRKLTYITLCIIIILAVWTCSDQNSQFNEMPVQTTDGDSIDMIVDTTDSIETNIADPEPMSVEQGNTELIFRSGFEAETVVLDQTDNNAEITGIDQTLPDLNNWEIDLNEHPKIGYFNIQYQGGDSLQRLAEIVQDPHNLSNNALRFWIKEPNDEGAGRIQTNIYSNNNIKELYYSVRMMIPEDFSSVENAPFHVNWLTLMEFWNNANWTEEDYQYRMTVNLQKVTARNEHLKIGIKSQVRESGAEEWRNPPIWEYINYSYAVPIGKWMRIDIYFAEGDKENGRFIFGITPDGGETTVVHDIRDFTHHPEDPNPNGLSNFNPMKLYTSSEVIDYVRGTDRLLNVYWDDFKLSLAAPQ